MSASSFLSKKMSQEQDDSIHIAPLATSQPLSGQIDPAYPLVNNPEHVEAGEYFAVLRTRVLNAHERSGARTILITSAQKGEGKSLISTNLAISLAQLAKHRILLVDGDLRVAGITELLNLRDQAGITDFLQGTVTFDNIIHPSFVPLLSVIAAGTTPAAAVPGVLEGAKWAEFMENAKKSFDFIIVDSVPVIAPIADFELLSAPCDGLLLVVHLHKTNRELLDRTMQQMNGKLLGVVINNAEPTNGYDYYSHYYVRTGDTRSRTYRNRARRS